MRVARRSWRGRSVVAGVSAVVLVAVGGGVVAHAERGDSAGPHRATADHPAPQRAAASNRAVSRDSALQQAVEAVQGTGTVGAFGEVVDADGGRKRARAGTAEAGTGREMPREGRFRIGSATKSFTATVVLQLVGEGRMSLDDSVERWLPGVVRGNGNDGRRITVRQLLQHTSGIYDAGADVAALHSAEGYRKERLRTYTPEELVASAMRHRPGFPPGEGWSYSNTNYVLLAMVVGEVTGRSWAQEVEGRIIRPLGLRGTSVPGTFPGVKGPHARGYAFDAEGGAGPTDVTLLNPSMGVGAGSIVSTAYDVDRFYAALLGGRLLAPAELAEMKDTVAAPELGVKYGLGLAEIPLSCGGSYFGHVGELLGYRGMAGAVEDGSRAVTVYTTGDGGEKTQEAVGEVIDQELCARE